MSEKVEDRLVRKREKKRRAKKRRRGPYRKSVLALDKKEST